MEVDPNYWFCRQLPDDTFCVTTLEGFRSAQQFAFQLDLVRLLLTEDQLQICKWVLGAVLVFCGCIRQARFFMFFLQLYRTVREMRRGHHFVQRQPPLLAEDRVRRDLLSLYATWIGKLCTFGVVGLHYGGSAVLWMLAVEAATLGRLLEAAVYLAVADLFSYLKFFLVLPVHYVYPSLLERLVNLFRLLWL